MVSSFCTFDELDCSAIRVMFIGKEWCSADIKELRASVEHRLFQDNFTWIQFNVYLDALRRQHPHNPWEKTVGFRHFGT